MKYDFFSKPGVGRVENELGVEWFTPLTQALGKHMSVDLCVFEASLVYIESSKSSQGYRICQITRVRQQKNDQGTCCEG